MKREKKLQPRRVKLTRPGTKLEWAVDRLRTWFHEKLCEGFMVECPCCGQTGKVYKRTINSTMARQLIEIYKASRPPFLEGGGFVNVKRFYLPGASGDYAKLRFWGLITPKEVRTQDENASGMWQITHKGRQFVRGHYRVRKYAYVYNNEVYVVGGNCFGGPTLNIQDALSKKFDYQEVMEAPVKRLR